jgi:hypothetical protein
MFDPVDAPICCPYRLVRNILRKARKIAEMAL